MRRPHVIVTLIVSVALGISGSRSLAADAYPGRPIRLVVPTGAGGITDILARVVAEKLRGTLGQQIVVDNRGGAGGIIGSDIVAKAAPDGYTLLMVFPSHPVNPSLFRKMPFDTLRDFAPITMVGTVTQVLLVHPTFPAKSVKELIAYAVERPGQLNFGTVGRGSLGYLSAELFASLTGIRIVHVAYKGAPQVMTALIAGEVQIYFNVPITALPQIKAGKVRALGVSTKSRLAIMPDVPTIAESGVPGYEVVGWNGILAPARTPRPIIERLHAEIVKVLRSPDVVEQLTTQGVDPIGNTPEEFAAIIRTDVEKWARVLKSAGVAPN
jgi:tripartite-type tricarboxylate transporter receptor subunit TctC